MKTLYACLSLVLLLGIALGATPTEQQGRPPQQERPSHRHPPPPIDFYKRNFNTLKAIYNLTIYPNQMPIIAGGSAAVPAGLFNAQVQGRINPVGNFTGITESIEYFFALPPNPTNNPNKAGLSEIVFTSFASSCPEIASFKAFSPIVILDPTSPRYGQVISYLVQEGFWKFDETGAAIAYDLILPSLEEPINAILGNQSDPLVQAATIQTICETAQNVCLGSNTQFSSVADCLAQLNAKPYGAFSDAWSDTVACRFLHVILATVDPTIHCPHVGPTGGMKCVTYPYANKYVLDDIQLFGSYDAFICPTKPSSNSTQRSTRPSPTRHPWRS